jgi:GTP-dependent dephospho-CoA kinase
VSRSGVRYRLPVSLRLRLKRPLAPVVDEEGLLDMEREGRLGRPIICVGDIVCETLLRLGLEPKVLVFDLVTLRGTIPEHVERALLGLDSRLVVVDNPAGTITAGLDDALAEALAREGRTRIRVEGEEDLAGLPAIMHAPLGATMIYGMPNQGLVPVSVTPENRAVAGDILSLMKVGQEAAT